jgi:hypothetical protein
MSIFHHAAGLDAVLVPRGHFSLVTQCDDSATYPLDERSVPMNLAQRASHREPPRMNDIRDLVATTLNGLGIGNAKSLGEQLVCCDNCRVGVRFAFEGVSAIWLNDANLVRFVDDSGRLLKVVRLIPRRDVVEKVA